MNSTTFSRACGLYKAGDYRGALRKFTECLKDSDNPLLKGESGQVYHRIGNCLMKMHNADAAIKAYRQAENDKNYTNRGPLHTNIGKALNSLKNYDEAIEEFNKAINDNNYDSDYKAYMGLGSANLKLGNIAEAGKCFREAALREDNPDPAKALLNLGICFMSLNRPEDAIQSYTSALEFDMSQKTRNQLQASMGQAYAANNQPNQAVECFKIATMDGTYTLSDSAAVDYSRCIADVARGVAIEQTQVVDDLSGLDVSASDDYTINNNTVDPYFYDEGTQQIENVQGYVNAYDDDEKFFTATDEEIKDIYKNMAKKDRKRRNVGLKIIISIIIVLIIVIGGGVLAYVQGYGYPTQETTSEALFKDPENVDGSLFAKSVSSNTIKQLMNSVIKDESAKTVGVQRSMSTSTCYVEATNSSGGKINYKITLGREVISWKVTNIELYFTSQNG